MEKDNDIDLKLKDIIIKPSIEEYPYGSIYCLSFIIDGIEYYKFTSTSPDNLTETALHHLRCILIDKVFD